MSSIILPERRLPCPTPWAEIFAQDAPLLVEIGFGGGHFLRHLAQKRPSANIIGVEISLPSLRRGERKIIHAGLSNVRLLQCSARYLLHALCAPGSVAEVYINFPDPWPKAAHHQRRLIDESFLHLLATRLEVDGRLDIATVTPIMPAGLRKRWPGRPTSAAAGPSPLLPKITNGCAPNMKTLPWLPGAPATITNGGVTRRPPLIFSPRRRNYPCPT